MTMMTFKDVKEMRKILKLNQAEFSQALNMRFPSQYQKLERFCFNEDIRDHLTVTQYNLMKQLFNTNKITRALFFEYEMTSSQDGNEAVHEKE